MVISSMRLAKSWTPNKTNISEALIHSDTWSSGQDTRGWMKRHLGYQRGIWNMHRRWYGYSITITHPKQDPPTSSIKWNSRPSLHTLPPGHKIRLGEGEGAILIFKSYIFFFLPSISSTLFLYFFFIPFNFLLHSTPYLFLSPLNIYALIVFNSP